MTSDERARIRADSLARLATLDRRRAIGLTVPESNESGAQFVCIEALDALDAADAEIERLRAALELAQLWLCNCTPTVELDAPKPLPVINAALTGAGPGGRQGE
jgi:hypothetical protein